MPMRISVLQPTYEYSFRTLQIYIPKAKTKIHTRPFLLVILMATHSSGRLMATTSVGREIEN